MTTTAAEGRGSPGGRYRQLDAALIVDTVERLALRIGERFPASGLGGVSRELLAVAKESAARLERLRRPIWPLRLAVGVLLATIGVVVIVSLRGLDSRPAMPGASEAIQIFESLVQDAIFIGIAIYFLVTLERRLKRRAALRAIHELRSIAHIVDMHQLTKDPEQFLSPQAETASSPRRTMTRFELGRYLDYCSELLSLTSKLGALYVATFDDPVVLASVNEVVTLTTGLSGKIWQKIMILDTALPQSEAMLRP